MNRNCDHCDKEVDVSIGSLIPFWCKECYVQDHSLLIEKGLSEASTDPTRHSAKWVWWTADGTIDDRHEKLKQIPKKEEEEVKEAASITCDHCNKSLNGELPTSNTGKTCSVYWCDDCYVQDKTIWEGATGFAPGWTKNGIHGWMGASNVEELRALNKKASLPKAEEVVEIVCDHCDRALGNTPIHPWHGETCKIHWCEDCWTTDKHLRDTAGVEGSGYSRTGMRGWAAADNVSKLRTIPKKTITPPPPESKGIVCDHCDQTIAIEPNPDCIIHWCRECDTQDRALWVAAITSTMTGYEEGHGSRGWSSRINAEKLRAIPKRIITAKPEQIEAVEIKTTPCDHCGISLDNTDLPTDNDGMPLSVFWCGSCYAEDYDKLSATGYQKCAKGPVGWINMEKAVRAIPKKNVVEHQADCDHCGKTIDVSSTVFDARAGGRAGCIYWCGGCAGEEWDFLEEYLISDGGKKYHAITDPQGNRQFNASIPLLQDIPKKVKELHAPCDHCGKDLDVSKLHTNVGDEYQVYWCASCVAEDKTLLLEDFIPTVMIGHSPPEKSYRGWIESAPQVSKIPKKVIEGVSYLNCADCGVQTLSKAPISLALCKSCGELHKDALLVASVPYAGRYDDFQAEWSSPRNVEKVKAILASAKTAKEKVATIEQTKETIVEEVKTCQCDHCGKSLLVNRICSSASAGEPIVWCRKCVSQNRAELAKITPNVAFESTYDSGEYLGENWKNPSEVAAIKAIPKICYCDHCAKPIPQDKLWDKFEVDERSTENFAWCKECSEEQKAKPPEQQPKYNVRYSVSFLASSLYEQGGYLGERFRTKEIADLKVLPKKEKTTQVEEQKIIVAQEATPTPATKEEASKEETLACLHCDKALPKSKVKIWSSTDAAHMWCKECIQKDTKTLSESSVGHMVAAYSDDPPRYLGETFTQPEINRLKKTFPEDFQEKQNLGTPSSKEAPRGNEPKVHIPDPNVSSAGCVCDHCGKGLLKEKVWTGLIKDYDTVWCKECAEEEKQELSKQGVSCVNYADWAAGGKVFEGETFVGASIAKIKAWPKKVIKAKEEPAKAAEEITVACDHCGASFPKKSSYGSEGAHKDDILFWCKECVIGNLQEIVALNVGNIGSMYYDSHPELLGEGWNIEGSVAQIKAIPKKAERCSCVHCGKVLHKNKISTVSGEDFSYVWCRECVLKEEEFLTTNSITHHHAPYETVPPLYLGETFGPINQAKLKIALDKREQKVADHIVCDHCGKSLLRSQLYCGEKAEVAWCRDCVIADREEAIKTGLGVLSINYYQLNDAVLGEGWGPKNTESYLDKLRAIPKKKILPPCQCDHCGKSLDRTKLDGSGSELFWCRECVKDNRQILTGTIKRLTSVEGYAAYNFEGESFKDDDFTTIQTFPKKTEMKAEEVLFWNGRVWEATPVPKVEPMVEPIKVSIFAPGDPITECYICSKPTLDHEVLNNYGKNTYFFNVCSDCAKLVGIKLGQTTLNVKGSGFYRDKADRIKAVESTKKEYLTEQIKAKGWALPLTQVFQREKVIPVPTKKTIDGKINCCICKIECNNHVNADFSACPDCAAKIHDAYDNGKIASVYQQDYSTLLAEGDGFVSAHETAINEVRAFCNQITSNNGHRASDCGTSYCKAERRAKFKTKSFKKEIAPVETTETTSKLRALIDEMIVAYQEKSPSLETKLLEFQQQCPANLEGLEQADLDRIAQVSHSKKAPQAAKLKLANRLIDLLKGKAYLSGGALRDLSRFEDFDSLDFFFPRHDPTNYGVYDPRKGVLDPGIKLLQANGFNCQYQGNTTYAKYGDDTIQARSYQITDPDTGTCLTISQSRTTDTTTTAERDHPFIAPTLDVDSLFFDKKTGTVQAHGHQTDKVFDLIGRKQYAPLSPNLQAALSGKVKEALDNKIKTLTEKGYTPTTNMSIDKSVLKVGDQINITITNSADGTTAIRKATIYRTDGTLFKSILDSEVSGTFGQSWELTSTQDIEAATKLGINPGSAKLGWAIDNNTCVDAVNGSVSPPVVAVKHAELQVGDKVALQYFSYVGEGVVLVAGNNPRVAFPDNGNFKHPGNDDKALISNTYLSSNEKEIAKQYGLDVETHRTYSLNDTVKATALIAKLETIPIDLDSVSLGDKVEVEIDLKDFRFDKTKSEKVIKTAWVVGQVAGARIFALETGLHPADGAANPCFHIGDYNEYSIEAKRLGINYTSERVGWNSTKSGTKIRKILHKAPPLIDPKAVQVGYRYEVEYRPGYQGIAVCIEKNNDGTPIWAFEKPLSCNLSLPSPNQKAFYQKYGIGPANTYTCWASDAQCKIRKEVGAAPVLHMHKDLVPGDVIEIEVLASGRMLPTSAIVVEIINGQPVLATDKIMPGGGNPIGGIYAHAATKAGWDVSACGTWALQENYDKVLSKQISALKLNNVPFSECKVGDLIDLEILTEGLKLRTEALVATNSSGSLIVVFRNRSDVASNCNGTIKTIAERYGFETEGTAYNISSTSAVIHKHLGKANLKTVYPSSVKAGDRIEVFTSGTETTTTAVVLQSVDESVFGEPLIAFEAGHPNGWILSDQKYQDLAAQYGLPAGAKIGRRVDGSTTFITKVLGRKGISGINVKPGDRVRIELDQAYSKSTPLPEEATVIAASGGGNVIVVLDEVYYDHLANAIGGSQFPTPITKDQAVKAGITLADNDGRVFSFSTGNGAVVVITDVNPDKEKDEEEDEEEEGNEVNTPIDPNSLQAGDQVILEISGVENEPIEVEAVVLGVDYNGFPLVFLEDEIKKALVFEQAQNRKACEALGFDPKERRGWEINPAKTKILEILDGKHQIEAEELNIGDRILVEIEDEGSFFTKEGIYVGLDDNSGLPTIYFNEPIEIDGEVASWQVDENTVPYLAAQKLGLYTDQDRYLNLDYSVVVRKIVAKATSPLDQDALEVEAEQLREDDPEEEENEEEETGSVFDIETDGEKEEIEADEEEAIEANSLSVGDEIEVQIESCDSEGEGTGKYEIRKATVVNTTWGSMPIIALEKAGFKKGSAEADTVCKLRDYGDDVIQAAKQLKISPDRKIAWSIDDMTSIVRVLSKATDTKTQNKEEDTTMPIDENGDEQTFLDTVKSDFSDAAARVASIQLVKGVKAGIVAAMRAKGVDGGKVQTMADMLDGEMGSAVISLALGWGLPQLPMEMLSDPRVVMLCKEFRINGMATVGNEVIGMAMEYIMPAITAALSSLPAATSDVVSKISGAAGGKKGRKRVATTKAPELETVVSEHPTTNGKSNGVISPG